MLSLSSRVHLSFVDLIRDFHQEQINEYDENSYCDYCNVHQMHWSKDCVRQKRLCGGIGNFNDFVFPAVNEMLHEIDSMWEGGQHKESLKSLFELTDAFLSYQDAPEINYVAEQESIIHDVGETFGHQGAGDTKTNIHPKLSNRLQYDQFVYSIIKRWSKYLKGLPKEYSYLRPKWVTEFSFWSTYYSGFGSLSQVGDPKVSGLKRKRTSH